ncbi:MAG: hypothetical protein NVSMB54_25470 [Ktedonobacteraceae bacterium]
MLAPFEMISTTPEVDTQPLPIPHIDAPVPTEAIVAGHICLDIIPTLTGSSTVFAPGRLIEAGKALLATGGPVSNTGLALYKLGVRTRLMGKVGNDLFGQAILQVLRGYEPELATGMVISPGEASSYSVIISSPGTDRVIIHAPGCNDTFQASDVYYDLLTNARLFHFGYPPLMASMYRNNGEELVALFQQAKATGVTTSLDLSMPEADSPAGRANWPAILAATLPYVDIFLPSIEELLLLLHRPLFEKFAREAKGESIIDSIPPDVVSMLGASLLDMGVKIVGIKMGHRGLYICTADALALAQMGHACPTQPVKLTSWVKRELWAPCFATHVVGTTGSGDATIAGFLMGFLKGMTPEATLATACAVGACSVEAADALGGIRSWPETLERIAAGWPRLHLEEKSMPSLAMSLYGWHWDEKHEIWVGPMNQVNTL